MSVWRIANKRVVVGIANVPERPWGPLTFWGRMVARPTGFRALASIAFVVILLAAAICLFPRRALSYTNYICVYPTILRGGSNGNNITGSTNQTAYVGQQIVLYANYALPSGATLNSQSWSVQGSTVGGFVNTSNNGGYTPAQFDVQQTTFYWIVQANTQTVTFTLNWAYNGTNTASKATATFNVYGPTSVGLSPDPPAMGTWNLTCTANFLEFGCTNLGTTPGITFNGSASSPSGAAGTYEWAQIITTNSNTGINGSTRHTYNNPTGLDTGFPYGTGLSANDSPGLGLSSNCTEQTFSVGATMYFMWNPETTSNDIAAPLGFANWSTFGDAANSSNNWTVQADSSGSANALALGSSSPVWSATVTGGNMPAGCP